MKRVAVKITMSRGRWDFDIRADGDFYAGGTCPEYTDAVRAVGGYLSSLTNEAGGTEFEVAMRDHLKAALPGVPVYIGTPEPPDLLPGKDEK